MKSPEQRPLSKGMQLIAEYRAARMSQGPIHKIGLKQSHAALRKSREQALRRTESVAGGPVAEAVDALHLSYRREESAQVSVFAGLLSVASAENVQTMEMPASEPEPQPVSDPVSEGVQDDTPRAASEPVETAGPDPLLAEIGFGPGMLIRLSQIGVRTTRDLAETDVKQLRAALGDIVRLVDVDGWIQNARARVGP